MLTKLENSRENYEQDKYLIERTVKCISFKLGCAISRYDFKESFAC